MPFHASRFQLARRRKCANLPARSMSVSTNSNSKGTCRLVAGHIAAAWAATFLMSACAAVALYPLYHRSSSFDEEWTDYFSLGPWWVDSRLMLGFFALVFIVAPFAWAVASARRKPALDL